MAPLEGGGLVTQRLLGQATKAIPVVPEMANVSSRRNCLG